MSIRQILLLERELWSQDICVHLTVKEGGLLVEGVLLTDRLIACSELRKKGCLVVGHAFRKAERE